MSNAALQRRESETSESRDSRLQVIRAHQHDLFEVRVFNPYAPSNHQPLIAKARPTMLAFRLL